MAVQPDGKIVAGHTSNGSDYDFAVVRYTADGSLDTSFSGDGTLTTTIGASLFGDTSVAVQADGKIVVAGTSAVGSREEFAVVRYRGDDRAPVPLPATFRLNEDSSLSVAAPYFYDPDGDPVTTALLSGPAHGTLTLNAYGQLTYTPFADYSGTDSFSYRVSDSFGGSADGSISLLVQPVNDAPVAAADGYSTAEDTPLQITFQGLLANDGDVDTPHAQLAVTAWTQPSHGTLAAVNGQLVYTRGRLRRRRHVLLHRQRRRRHRHGGRDRHGHRGQRRPGGRP